MLVTSCSSLHTKAKFEKHVIITTIIRPNRQKESIQNKFIPSESELFLYLDQDKFRPKTVNSNNFQIKTDQSSQSKTNSDQVRPKQ